MFTATVDTTLHKDRLAEWGFDWDTTFSITHTDEEWKEWRDHGSNIYNCDFEQLKNYCIANGKPKWYCVQLRQLIELEVVRHYMPDTKSMYYTTELLSFLELDELTYQLRANEQRQKMLIDELLRRMRK